MPKSNKPYRVVALDGEFLVHISRAERNRLIGCTDDGKAIRYGEGGEPIFGPRLIRMHRKRSSLYFALVDAAVIRAEVRRDILNLVPRAEANRTVQRVTFGAGAYFEHNVERCYSFRTTEAAAKEPSDRQVVSQDQPRRANVIEFPTRQDPEKKVA